MFHGYIQPEVETLAAIRTIDTVTPGEFATLQIFYGAQETVRVSWDKRAFQVESDPMGTNIVAALGETSPHTGYKNERPLNKKEHLLDDEDMVLESPDWLASKSLELEKRNFVRINDPRRNKISS